MTAEAARELLTLARAEQRAGSLARAWDACRSAARVARTIGDAGLMADAALTITGPSIADWSLTASRQSLCLEALGMLGDADPETSRLLTAQLAAISTAWSVSPAPVDRVAPRDAQRDFVGLQAEHAAAMGPAGVGERLEVANRALALGIAATDDAMVAWARLWRLDALEQLGLRIPFNTELLELTAVAERLASPVWTWRLATIRANLALLEDRLLDVPALAAEARSAGTEAGVDEAPYLDLLLRSTMAERTGTGLAEIEEEVRRAIAGAPFFVQAWRATILLSLGREDGALSIWRALAPHLDELPPDAIEWLVAATALASLAIAAQDRDAARRLRAALRPFAHLHIAPSAMTPYDGPVVFVLGELSTFLGDRDEAAALFATARSRAEAMHAPWHAARADERRLALGRGVAPLSPRETEIAREVAAGRTNREIAARLFLSDRTVEQHVRSILRKLDLPTRAAIAAWIVRRPR